MQRMASIDVILCNWESANTREKCARFFSAQIKRLFTFLAKNITDRTCLQKICELREKFNIACDTVYTCEQVIEMVGPVLLKWIDKIIKYDYEFFKQTNITILITDAVGNNTTNIEDINDDMRALFDKSLTMNMRVIIFDVLNILLRLYARYDTFDK